MTSEVVVSGDAYGGRWSGPVFVLTRRPLRAVWPCAG